MRIATGLDVDGTLEQVLTRATKLREQGFTSLWASQILGPDTLTTLAIVGHQMRDLDLGTAVVPIQPRHPNMLAAQARTVQGAIGGHLTLGIGLSHKMVVERMWGMSFEKPATYMREYVAALAPMLRGEAVTTSGERVSAVAMGPLGPKDPGTPSLIIAALGSVMLDLAGREADGTALWMTGRKTIESHIAPRLREAAEAAGRTAPRIICSLPMVVTSDVDGARARVNETYALYGNLPSYRAMLDREGAVEVADAALIGSKAQVLEMMQGLADAGVTEFSGAASGTAEERQASIETLLEYQAG